jgi:hypothetical protein
MIIPGSYAWPDPEIAFVAKASVGAADGSAVRDWRRVISLALRHRVFPRVLRYAAKTLPPHAAAALREHAALNSKAALANLARTLHVHQLLTSRGVQPLIIKGPLLSRELYRDVTTRVSGDVDVLVPQAQFVKAARLLAADGYLHHTRVSPAALEKHRRSEHDVAFAHLEDGILVELHADIAQPHYAYRLSISDMWKTARTHVVGGVALNTPSLENAYIIAALHAARHRWSRLDLIADVAAFEGADMDWTAVQHIATQGGIRRIVEVAETLTAFIRDGRVSANPPLLVETLLKNLAQGADFSRWRGFWVDWSVRERSSDRLAYALRRGLRRPMRALQ